jgi:hypothetical protein
MKLKGRRFENSNIRRESQGVLNSSKENYLHSVFKALKKYEIAVYVLEETVLKEIASKIE